MMKFQSLFSLLIIACFSLDRFKRHPDTHSRDSPPPLIKFYYSPHRFRSLPLRFINCPPSIADSSLVPPPIAPHPHSIHHDSSLSPRTRAYRTRSRSRFSRYTLFSDASIPRLDRHSPRRTYRPSSRILRRTSTFDQPRPVSSRDRSAPIRFRRVDGESLERGN